MRCMERKLLDNIQQKGSTENSSCLQMDKLKLYNFVHIYVFYLYIVNIRIFLNNHFFHLNLKSCQHKNIILRLRKRTSQKPRRERNLGIVIFVNSRAPLKSLWICIYFIQHCFIRRPSDSTVPEDAGNEPRTGATLLLVVRRSNHSGSQDYHCTVYTKQMDVQVQTVVYGNIIPSPCN
jgi:hypothetical protein